MSIRLFYGNSTVHGKISLRITELDQQNGVFWTSKIQLSFPKTKYSKVFKRNKNRPIPN